MTGRMPGRHGGQRAWRRRLRRLALASFVASSLAVIGLAMPLVVHGQTEALASYGGTASGWSIQPYAINDAYLNLPADQAAPYVYVNIDNSPTSQAKAAYFFPGNAVNGVLAAEVGPQGVHYQVPSGVVVDYPSAGNTSNSASNHVAAINDGQTTQIGAGSQSAQATEAYAQATASLASYQFAPPPGLVPTSTQPPSLPTVVGSPPALPTGLPGTGSTATPSHSSPTPTATSGGGGGPTPTPTPCALIVICPPSSGQSGTSGHVVAAPMASGGIKLPDVFEQALASALRATEVAHPGLLTLAHGQTPTLDPNLPFASADATSSAVVQASDNGVTAQVQTSAQHVQLLQGLITFDSLRSTLQGLAPATQTLGSGTITTKIVGAEIAGIPVTIDAQGVQIDCQGSTQPPCVGSGSGATIQTLTDALNQALAAAGLKLILNQNETVSHIEMWQGTGGGVDLSGTLNPPNTSGIPLPTAVSPSQLDISLGRVSANLYALAAPPVQVGGGGGGSFYPGQYIPPSFSYVPGSAGSPSGTGGGSGLIGPLLGTLNQPQMLALLVVVQGLSIAAVAGTAGNASAAAKSAQVIVEEESR